MRVITERPGLPGNMISQSGVTIVHLYNVLDPSDREIFHCNPGSVLKSVAPVTRLPTVCMLNGEYVHPCDWEYIDLESTDMVSFLSLPQGGGGGGNSLLQVLGAVLLVAGIFTGNPYLITGGLGLLASGLLPALPSQSISAVAALEQSPTYTIALSGNSARLGQAIPVPYGRHIISPDFAANSYVEYDEAGDQFYHALLCFGAGDEMTVESVMIDDTVIAHFVDVQMQYIGPAYAPTPTLINPAVVNAPEVAGQELIFGTYVGPFASSGPGLLTYKIDIDIICPRGLYFAADDGTLSPKTVSWLVEIRTITDSGAVSGSWLPLGLESLTLASNSAVRRSHSYTVAPGRYQVRLQRQEVKDTNARSAHEITWVGLRSYIQVDTPLEPGANYLAVRIKATNQLSGLSQRKFSLILRRKLPTWSPISGWSALVETRSIAWAICDVLRNPLYGGLFSDSRIDLLTLYQLDQVWAARGDYFNGIFDQRTTIWEALTRIARCGRAKPVLRGNIITFVRDQPMNLPVALFNMRNIRKGSFNLAYRVHKEDDPDGLVMEFFDERTWSPNYITMALPGVIGEPVQPARVAIKGITNLKQAQRELAYMAADSRYRPVTVTFTTELEGFLPALGDLIATSHDLTSWGISGELETYAYPNVTCSENLIWSVGPNYAVFVDQYGDFHGPYLVVPGNKPRSMQLSTTLPFSPYTGSDRERTKFAMGPASAYAKMCKVLSISPASDDTVQITSTVEDARVHAADAPYLGDGSVLGGGSSGGTSGSRVARYAPDGVPNYNAASDAQRAAYGFYSDTDITVGTSNDPGYTYGV